MANSDQRILQMLERPSPQMVRLIWRNLPSPIECDLKDEAAIERMTIRLAAFLRRRSHQLPD